MTTAPRHGETLRLKVLPPVKAAAPPKPAPVPVANGHPQPKQQPKAAAVKAAKPKGPAWMPKEWEPAATAAEMLAQLPDLVTELHEVFRLGVAVPLAIGAREGLREVARDGCRQRCARWLAAWVRTPEYLAALAAEGAMRHDRTGVAVEPVAEEHVEEARQRLACRRRGVA